MTTEMPRFDFSDCEIKDDASLEAELKKEAGGNYFNPGQYDVEIEAVTYKGPAKGDKNWSMLEVVLKGTGGKTIKEFLLVPHREVKYGEKQTMYPFKKLQKFCGGLGVSLTIGNLADALKVTFAKPEKLKGRALNVTIGYTKGHVDYAGKSADGNSQYVITMADGNKVSDDVSKEAVVFPDRAAALAYAEERKIAVDKFVSVTDYTPGQSQVTAGW